MKLRIIHLWSALLRLGRFQANVLEDGLTVSLALGKTEFEMS